MTWTWTWQDPIVALIVAYAVVALVRHVRAIVGSAAPASKAQGSCHGCDDGCGTGDIAPPRRPPAAPLPPGNLRVHRAGMSSATTLTDEIKHSRVDYRRRLPLA